MLQPSSVTELQGIIRPGFKDSRCLMCLITLCRLCAAQDLPQGVLQRERGHPLQDRARAQQPQPPQPRAPATLPPGALPLRPPAPRPGARVCLMSASLCYTFLRC